MKEEQHLQAFEEREETIFKWAVEVRGIENSSRIIGDNVSRAIVELLSVYLHQKRKVEEGFQLNHAWFKSEKVIDRLPEFEHKAKIIGLMVKLELLCEKLSYGTPRSIDSTKKALELFNELESLLKKMIS